MIQKSVRKKAIAKQIGHSAIVCTSQIAAVYVKRPSINERLIYFHAITLFVNNAAMMNTVKAIIKEGNVELLEPIQIPDGTELLVTILSEEKEFWLQASDVSLASVWNNKEDNVYAELLKR